MKEYLTKTKEELILELEKLQNENALLKEYYNTFTAEHKHYDEEPLQKQVFMSLLMDNVSEYIYFKDRDSRFIKISKSLANAFGLTSPDQALGKSDFNFFSEVHARQALEDEQKIIETGIPCSKEEIETRTDRPDRWVLTTKFPLRNSLGFIIGTFGISKDITDRKKAEQQIKEANEHFEHLFNLNPEAVNIVRLSNNQLININKGYSDMTGYTRDELLNNTTIDLNIWVNPSERHQLLNIVIEKGYCSNFESRFRHKEGRIITGIISSKIIDIFGEPHLLNVIRDISRRKMAEEALLNSEKALKKSEQIAGLGTYEFDFNSGRWTSSEILDSILGIDASYDKSIKKWIELIHPQWQKPMTDYLEKEVIKNHHKFDKEFKIVRYNDKKNIWVHGMGELLYDKDGQLSLLAGTFQDITRRKESELIIQKQNIDLQELIATKDKFFSIIAHDLKNPFNALICLSEILISNYNSMDRKVMLKYITLINNSATQTHSLLINLLEWSRLQQGLMTPLIQNIECGTNIEEACQILNAMAKNKNITLQNNNRSEVYILADKHMIDSILRNLISNAIKFTNAEGTITIAVKQHPSDIEIQIKDNGVGMSPKTLSHLFTLEKTFSKPGTAKEQGTGLGLLLCKEFIELQGGKIWATSKEGEGSTFCFSLPKPVKNGGQIA